MSEVKFVEGLIAKAPHDNAPEYVKAKLSIKREELIAWLQQQEGDWVNAEIKVSQGGKWYIAVDDWKPQQGGSGGTRRAPSDAARRAREELERPAPAAAGDAPFDDDIPFD